MRVDHCAGDRVGARVVVELEQSDVVRRATAAASDRGLQVPERERYEGTMRVLRGEHDAHGRLHSTIPAWMAERLLSKSVIAPGRIGRTRIGGH
jgi:hypothetical protein